MTSRADIAKRAREWLRGHASPESFAIMGDTWTDTIAEMMISERDAALAEVEEMLDAQEGAIRPMARWNHALSEVRRMRAELKGGG